MAKSMADARSTGSETIAKDRKGLNPRPVVIVVEEDRASKHSATALEPVREVPKLRQAGHGPALGKAAPNPGTPSKRGRAIHAILSPCRRVPHPFPLDREDACSGDTRRDRARHRARPTTDAFTQPDRGHKTTGPGPLPAPACARHRR
jgi:hypothetical protein